MIFKERQIKPCHAVSTLGQNQSNYPKTILKYYHHILLLNIKLLKYMLKGVLSAGFDPESLQIASKQLANSCSGYVERYSASGRTWRETRRSGFAIISAI